MQAQGSSDPGRVREENQDVFLVREDLRVALLADGMGGTRAGGMAAEIAVDAALEHLTGASKRGPLAASNLSQATKQANDRVVGMSNAISSYRGMGTTLVATALVEANRGYVAHVGDSRAYRFRGGELQQVTKDHSLVQEWVDAGVISETEARHAPNRNVITRAIGASSSVQPDVTEVDLAADDLLLMCSDGLTGMLTDEQIAFTLSSAPCGTDEELAQAAAALVDAANRAGGTDNITVVLVRC